jgi:hypothetical protein
VLAPGYPGRNYTFSCTNVEKSKLRWDLNIPGTGSRTYTNISSITVTPTAGGILSAKVSYIDGCPEDNYASVGFLIQSGTVIIPTDPISPGIPIVAAIFNETIPEGTESVEPLSEDGFATAATTSQSADIKTVRVPYEGEYTVELWHDVYGLIGRYHGDTPTIEIPTIGAQTGVHYLRLIVNGQLTDVAKVIIR